MLMFNNDERAWGSSYGWADGDAEGARNRALKAKLIADLRLK